MKKFWIGFVLWVFVSIAGVVWLLKDVNQDIEHSGSKLVLEVGINRYLDIKSNSPVTLEAVSSKFFVLRKESGEVIAATPAEVPLGWTEDEYFTAGPVEISNGRWIVEQGNLTLRLSSEEEMKVVEVATPQRRSNGGLGAFLAVITLALIGGVLMAFIFVDG